MKKIETKIQNRIISCDADILIENKGVRRCGHKAYCKTYTQYYCIKHGLEAYGFTKRHCNRRVLVRNYGIRRTIYVKHRGYETVIL